MNRERERQRCKDNSDIFPKKGKTILDGFILKIYHISSVVSKSISGDYSTAIVG